MGSPEIQSTKYGGHTGRNHFQVIAQIWPTKATTSATSGSQGMPLCPMGTAEPSHRNSL